MYFESAVIDAVDLVLDWDIPVDLLGCVINDQAMLASKNWLSQIPWEAWE